MARKKNKKPSLLLAILVAISSLTLPSIAAYISISGLTKIFPVSAAFVLFAALEGSKLVTASLLHNQWQRINKGLKVYLTIAVVTLILITSAGLYSFLSSAYSKTATQIELATQQNGLDNLMKTDLEKKIINWQDLIETKNNRIETLTDLRVKQEVRLDTLTNRRWSNSLKRTEDMIRDANNDIDQLNIEIDSLSTLKSDTQQQIYDLETGGMIREQDQADSDVLTFVYISELTGLPIDKVINVLVILLVFIFDPLAVLLLVSFNSLLKQRREAEDEEEVVIPSKGESNNNINASLKLEEVDISEKNDDIVSEDEIPTLPFSGETIIDMKENDLTLKTATGEYPIQEGGVVKTATGEYQIEALGDLTDEERNLLLSTLKSKRQFEEEKVRLEAEEASRLEADRIEQERIEEIARLKREEELRERLKHEEEEKNKQAEIERQEEEKRQEGERKRKEALEIEAEIKKEEDRMEKEEQRILSSVTENHDLYLRILNVLYDGGNKIKGNSFETYNTLKANLVNAGVEATDKQFDDFLTVCALMRIIKVDRDKGVRELLKDYKRAKMLLSALSS